MSKSKTTKDLEKALYKHLHKRGVFLCPEVTIGWYGKERVDYLSYDTKGIFRCYEIKSSVEDFHSRAKKTFIGHYNYYVMPQELYDKVKDEIPNFVGVYVYDTCVKKPKKQEVDEKTLKVLKDSLIRSLYRYFEEIIQSKNETVIKSKNRQISYLEYQRDNYRSKYYEALDKIRFLERKQGKR